ncbi:MAG: PAS domain S-box protein [Anaerolineaceae bacterium]|nr:PAS domain S-box protein [Anaerolineaceae bacterium]
MMTENISVNSLLDAVASPLLICQNNNILYANLAAQNLTGYSSTELLAQPADTLIYQTSSKVFTAWHTRQLSSPGAETVDVRLLKADQSLVWVRLTAAATLFEGKSAQLLTLQDISHQRQTETELYLNKTYREMLLVNNPDVVMMTDHAGNLTYVSPSIEAALGYDTNDVIGQKWLEKIHPDDQEAAIRAAQEVRKTNSSVRMEVRIRNHEGDYLWFEGLVGIVAHRQNGETTLVSTVRNIHKHKLTELALREREQNLRLITDNMQDIVLEIAPDGRIRYISPSCVSIMGYTPDDLIGTSHLTRVHPDDVPAVLEYFSQALLKPSLKPLELRFQHKEGHFLWVEIVYKLVTDESGDLQSMIISAREISERKQVEEAFRQNRYLLQGIMDTVPSGIYLFDIPSGQSVFHNQKSVMGYTDEAIKEVGEKFYLNLTHPDDLAVVEENNRRLHRAKDGEVIVTECRIKHADGKTRWHQFRDTVFARHANGTPRQYLRTSYEITERKLAEEALQQNQHLLQQITDIAPIGIYIYDVKKQGDIYHNQKAELDTGLDTVSEPLPEKFYANYVHKDDAGAHAKHQIRLMQAKDGEIIESENRIRVPDGSYRWFNFRDVVFKRDENGKPSQFLGSMQDVTERKQAEQALRDNQNLLEKITNTAPFGIYIYDVEEGRDIYHNKRLQDNAKPQPNPDVTTENFYAAHIHPDDVKIHEAHRQHLMSAQDGEVIESEVRARSRKGEYEWLYFRDIVFARDENGKPSQFLGSMQNITERKQAEQALRDNQNLLKQITGTVPLDIYIYDVDLKRNVFFNRTKNMGYPLEELDKQSYGDFYASLVHPDDLELHHENAKRLISARDGELLHSEYRMKHASGEYRWYDFRDIVFNRHEDGTPRQFLGSVQDITARKETEAALRQSQDVLQRITSTVPMDIYIYDVDLDKTIFANRDTNLGLASSISLNAGKDFFRNLVHPDDLAIYDDFNDRLAVSTEGTFVQGEFRMRRSDGTWMWRNYRNMILHRHADGTPSQYLGTVEDITVRKEIEAALRQSQHMFQKVAETVPMQIFIYDYDLKKNIFENRPSDLGFDKAIVSNASDSFFTGLIHPDDRQTHDEIMLKLQKAADGEMLENEFRMRDVDGVYAWRNYRYIPFARRPDGTISQFLGTVLNVDERKKVSDALRENEEKLRLITDNIHDLVALTDDKMHFRYLTPSHQKILGYKPEDLIGTSIFDLLHPDDLEMVKAKVFSALEKQHADTAEFRYRHHDGYYLWMETNGSLVASDNGDFSGAVFASRDVSERRWMQRAMLEQERLLVMLQKEQELSALKTRMMSRLSHELRTPLAIISTSADLLDTYGKRMTEEQRTDRLHQIKSQIKHFTSMLDNMALVVKGISYSIDFSPAPYNLEATAKSIAAELKELLHVTHTVELALQGDLSVVNSDEQLMRLILTHLLANAFKYSPPTKPVVISAAMSDETITIEVRDQGIGILPEECEIIFEPFVRGTNIGEVQGLGIGLSIVKDAVESMNGKIDVASELAVGTTVKVEIPLGGVIGIN